VIAFIDISSRLYWSAVLLADKLPETMTEEQKERKILYLLTRLKKKGAIVRDADSRKMTNWIIKDEKNG